MKEPVSPSARGFVSAVFLILLAAFPVFAQSTGFTYQSRLTDSNLPANGSYDFQFKLFDSLTGGTQIGSTNSQTNVAVNSGVFAVTLDFGPTAFPGTNRWLEISVRLAGGGQFTTLAPRRAITATPYALKSLNATTADSLSSACAGCVADVQIAALSGSKVTGTVANATNAINATNATQLGSIAASQYVLANDSRLSNQRLPLPGSSNYIQNGASPQAGSFSVSQTGTVGQDLNAGRGVNIDMNNTYEGDFGATFGGLRFGSTGGLASGEGIASKRKNDGNLFGLNFYTNYTSRLAITQAGNVGIGTDFPENNLSVQGGLNIDQGNANDGSAYINALRFGGGSGESIASRRTAGANGFGLDFYTGGTNRMSITNGGSVGIGTNGPTDKLQVFGDVRLGTSGSNGCIKRADGSGITGICSSDLRFKRDITPFPNVLYKLTQLQPVHYFWRAAEFPAKHFGDTQSYGLIAQDVEQVLPELVVKDDAGYGAIDYSKLPLLLLQATKEMKVENDALKQETAVLKQKNEELRQRLDAELKRQDREIESLKKLVCLSQPNTEFCKSGKTENK